MGTWLARAGWLCAALVLLWLLVPGGHPVPVAVVATVIVGALAAHGAAVVHARLYRSAPRFALLRIERAMVATTVALLLLVLVLLVFWPGVPSLSLGNPSTANGTFFLDSHGATTPVSRETYLRSVEKHEALFDSAAMLFFLVAAVRLHRTAIARDFGTV